MEFIPLSVLKEISGYRDRRSVAKWVQKSLGIQLQKIGKNWCVLRKEYEDAIRLRYHDQKTDTTPKRNYIPANGLEHKFLSELGNLLSVKQEL